MNPEAMEISLYPSVVLRWFGSGVVVHDVSVDLVKMGEPGRFWKALEGSDGRIPIMPGCGQCDLRVDAARDLANHGPSSLQIAALMSRISFRCPALTHTTGRLNPPT